MVRVAFGALITLLVLACAGRSISQDEGQGGSSGDDTGGSAGTTGGFGGTGSGFGGTVTTGGSGATVASGGVPAQGGRAAGGRGGTMGGGRGGTAGTAGVLDPICTLPPDPGPCEAAIRAYTYDVETGLCLPFIYGGCEGNANRFPTAEDCYRACEGARIGGTAYCESSLDCSPISTGCCGCTAASFETVVGVNHEHLPIIDATKCATVDCDPCGVDPAFAWFGASCRENHCVAWDAREEELTLCTRDADCRLRNGLDCCERCDGGADELIAVNSTVAQGWVCPDGQPPCGACPSGGPTYPGLAFPACANGRCAVYLE